MADYKTMYTNIFNAVTDAISILQKAQAEAEEMFIAQEVPKITILKYIEENENK